VTSFGLQVAQLELLDALSTEPFSYASRTDSWLAAQMKPYDCLADNGLYKKRDQLKKVR